MRALVLGSVLLAAAVARAEDLKPLSCRQVAAAAIQELLTATVGEVPANADEKRVFGELGRGIAEECLSADGGACYTRVPGEAALAPTGCPADPLKGWMTTIARQILPTQTRKNRATQALERLLEAPPPAAPSTAAAPPLAAAPPPPPPDPRVAQLTAPPPPPPSEPDPEQPAQEEQAVEAEPPAEKDAPTLEGDELLSFPLANLSRRELKHTATLLQEQKPGLGLVFGMYGGGLGGLAVGSFFLANSFGYYGVNTFLALLGGVALTAGVVFVVIGTVALVSRLRKRSAYNSRLNEIEKLLKGSRQPKAELSPLPPMLTLAQW